MLAFMLAVVGVVAAMLVREAVRSHPWSTGAWMLGVFTMLVTTWVIGRRADRDTQHRLTLVLTVFLIAMALSGRSIVRWLMQW